MWMLRAMWLVVTHVLLEYRYMDDVTGNLCVVLLNMVRGFENVCEIISDWASKSLENKFRMSYLQRGKMEKQRRKEYLTTWECLYNKLTGRKLHESWSCVIASRDSLICKMFSPLFCFKQVKTLKNFSRKLFKSKIKEKRRNRDEN